MEFNLTPVGAYNFRNQHKVFGIKVDDRRRHIYVAGKTGVGKSTLLENMIIADVRSGKGVGIVDPHGELAEKILDFIPEERLDDVIYFDPSDMDFPIAFNPMEQVGNEFRHLVASGIMGVFKKIWPDAWSARMEYILNNTLLALLELPDATLLGILRMFAEPEYRKKIVENLKDPVIKAFWQNEFARYSQKLETEALAAIQNKVGQFVSNPLIRNILGQPRSALNMRQIMDTGKIFIVNLSKGKIGEDNSALLGAMIITRLNLAAMSRVDIAERDRRDFFLYVDEFQNFATDSFANILSEARKYHLSLTLAHQYIGQLTTSDSTKVRDAIFGNVGTIISFRVGADDAEFLEKEFMPEFLQTDLVNLAKANIYIKLMIDGIASRPFSAETIAPQPTPLNSYKDVIIKNSREKYGTPRAVVEARIAGEWLAKSDVAIGEKIERQGERRLSEVLRPNSRPAYGPGRPPSSGHGGNQGFGPNGPSRPSSFSRPPMPASTPMNALAARPPRRMEDVQRQDAPNGESQERPLDVRAGMPSQSDSTVRPVHAPEQKPIAGVNSEGNDAIAAPQAIHPLRDRDAASAVPRSPMNASSPSRMQAASPEPQQRVASQRPEIIAKAAAPREDVKSPAAVPSSAPVQKSVEAPVRLPPAESAAPRGLSLSALKNGGAGVRKEDQHGMPAARGDADNGSDASQEVSQRKVVKPSIDIEGLRRAINDSLRKQSEGLQAHPQKIADGQPRDKKQAEDASGMHVRSHADSGGPASVASALEASGPRRSVRLNVPTHEDTDAKQQVNRELSRMDALRDEGRSAETGMGGVRSATREDKGGDWDDAELDEHDTRSIKEARERINQSLARQNVGAHAAKESPPRNIVRPAASATRPGSVPAIARSAKKSPDIVTSG